MRPPGEHFDILEEVLTCLNNPNMCLEVMLQLMAPDTQYPLPWAQDVLKRLYDFGTQDTKIPTHVLWM